jgi:hypothetical protein
MQQQEIGDRPRFPYFGKLGNCGLSPIFPGLEFGVRFPVTYREGEPFDVSLDDLEFEVPDVDPAALVDQLGAQIF